MNLQHLKGSRAKKIKSDRRKPHSPRYNEFVLH